MREQNKRLLSTAGNQRGSIVYAGIVNSKSRQLVCAYGLGSEKLRPLILSFVEKMLREHLRGDEAPPGECLKFGEEFRIFYSSFPAGYSTLVIVTEGFMVKHSLAFQRELSQLFETGWNIEDRHECAHFWQQLKQQVTQFNDAQARPKDGLDRIKDKQEEVKELMLDNLTEAINRSQKIEHMVEDTSDLAEETLNFRAASRLLRNTSRWEYTKQQICMLVLIIVCIMIVVGFVCGFAC